MSTPKDGGSAFPMPPFNCPNGDTDWGNSGMSLRDWFAGQALTGMLPTIKANSEDTLIHTSIPMAARFSYAIADAMLKARAALPEGENKEGAKQ